MEHNVFMKFFKKDTYKIELGQDWMNVIASSLFLAPIIYVIAIIDKLTWCSTKMLRKWCLSSIVIGAIFIIVNLFTSKTAGLDIFILVLGILPYAIILGISVFGKDRISGEYNLDSDELNDENEVENNVSDETQDSPNENDFSDVDDSVVEEEETVSDIESL